jgi:hypothetical protein
VSTTTDPEEARNSPIQANGEQEKYVVLSDEERAKGFTRPLRYRYVHVGPPGGSGPDGVGCGIVTTMNQAIAETYARDPHFYGGTYCAGCRTHLPVGEQGEFVWDGTEERVGT